jgi:hypothetical protein
VKLGVAAALVMSACSAERLTPEADPLAEADAELDAAEADVAGAELAGAELLELELDEQAARSSAAPTAVIPNAARNVGV